MSFKSNFYYHGGDFLEEILCRNSEGLLANDLLEWTFLFKILTVRKSLN